ncbi:response regulator [Desulfonatronum thioautotrophicum]|uniref:response regulator n=1 Tax=Desulfonatronum thioautotrophicum TaxID=617001 RepID=UPI0005EB72A2|nr:response regulator [Desulfonatronum thioautotrophicum]
MSKTMCILVVDDFATMRKIIKNILNQLEYKNIVDAEDGTAALDILNKRPVDFIISDWNMPKMTGIDFLRAVRGDKKFAHLPFIMVTAEGLQENIIEAVQAGVSQYVVKPFSPATLEEKINKCLGAG